MDSFSKFPSHFVYKNHYIG